MPRDTEKAREYARRYYEENREKVLARKKRYREEHREKVREQQQRYNEENPLRTWAHNAAHGAVRRAKQKHVPCLPLAELRAHLLALAERYTDCPCCGVQFTDANGTTCPTSRTTDRANPALGYVKGNIILTCHSCGSCKQSRTYEQWAQDPLPLRRKIRSPEIQRRLSQGGAL